MIRPTANIHHHTWGRGHLRKYQASFAIKVLPYHWEIVRVVLGGLLTLRQGGLFPLIWNIFTTLLKSFELFIWIGNLFFFAFFSFFIVTEQRRLFVESQGSALISPLNIWCFMWHKCMRGGRDQTLIPPPARLGSAYCLHSAISRHC